MRCLDFGRTRAGFPTATMIKKTEKVREILAILNRLYPFDGRCFLHYDHEQPWQLLFATILSAQCTDARVNIVTQNLFRQFPTLEAFAAANLPDIEKAVHQTGFFRAKARHLQKSAVALLANHGGALPSDIAALTALSGVGRKTANVVRGHIFGIPSIVVDTHVMRVSRKLGLTENTDPTKIEYDLMAILPEESWFPFNQQVILHGRAVCVARRPKCEQCEFRLACLCSTGQKS